ncbi:MAG: insulinase family protein [Zetaproteobacteria bacterium]|nr:insulinase family protein [Zetaproteobacteria bacterium]
MNYILSFLLLFILHIAAVPLNASPLQQTTFANGVKLVVDEDHSAPVAMVQVWLKVGGRDELPGKTGLAHVFEHMMFKGSKQMKAGEFSRRIAAMGGSDNAFTSNDYTAYFATVPAEKVADVLTMEAERFANLSLNEEDFAKEIKVIMEERRMRTEDDPNSRMFEELSAAALRLHPYRNPVIGWMQDLQGLTIEDVRAFYQLHYVPGSVTVVVVGDVDFEEVAKMVAQGFASMAPKPIPPRFNPQEPEPLGAKSVEVQLPAQLPMVAIAIPAPVWQPGINDADVAALALFTEMLSGGRSALLQQQLVEKDRLAFSIGAGYDPFGMGLDLWYMYGALGPGQSKQALEKAFWQLLQAYVETPPSEQRIAIAKRRLIANRVFAQDSLYLRAKEIGIMETVGIGSDQRDVWQNAIEKVTATDIQKAVGRWLRAERSTVGFLQPKLADTGVELPSGGK